MMISVTAETILHRVCNVVPVLSCMIATQQIETGDDETSSLSNSPRLSLYLSLILLEDMRAFACVFVLNSTKEYYLL